MFKTIDLLRSPSILLLLLIAVSTLCDFWQSKKLILLAQLLDNQISLGDLLLDALQFGATLGQFDTVTVLSRSRAERDDARRLAHCFASFFLSLAVVIAMSFVFRGQKGKREKGKRGVLVYSRMHQVTGD